MEPRRHSICAEYFAVEVAAAHRPPADDEICSFAAVAADDSDLRWALLRRMRMWAMWVGDVLVLAVT